VREGEKGPAAHGGSRAAERKRGRDGPAGPQGKGERGKGKWVSLFFKFFSNSFSNFQTSIKQETMHSNHDALSLIISKFISVVFKYFKSQFI
jgi:hypothetical protein